MLTPPELPDQAIEQCLREAYGIRVLRAGFLPLGADPDSAVFRVDTAGGRPYFLKLRRGGFREAAVAVPAFLHHEQGIGCVMAPLPTRDRRLSVSRLGLDWVLYPFFEGGSGFDRP